MLLILRYKSSQSYILKTFPLPSISLLNTLQTGGVDSIKALNLLHKNGKISCDIVLMVDEMYLQNWTQFHGGEYIGANEEGNLYKDEVVSSPAGFISWNDLHGIYAEDI